MNNTTNLAVGTGVIVVLGRWSKGKGLDVRVVVGVMFLAVALAVLPDKLAVPIAWLVLLTVSYEYLPGVITRSGIANSSTPRATSGGADSVVGV